MGGERIGDSLPRSRIYLVFTEIAFWKLVIRDVNASSTNRDWKRIKTKFESDLRHVLAEYFCANCGFCCGQRRRFATDRRFG